jgi:1,4-dihydroxy-6-naphthoate synthase
LALRLYEDEFEPVFIRFDEIMQAVADGSVDAGLLIHEGQLTHASFGLHTVVDLGAWWWNTTGLPLPLGLNAVRRDLGSELIRRVSALLHQSIRYALEHRQEALDYALKYGRGLSSDTADRFVGMYVNERTLDMGPDGREAVKQFLQMGAQRGLVPSDVRVEFAE